jgi:hypothetical protein
MKTVIQRFLLASVLLAGIGCVNHRTTYTQPKKDYVIDNSIVVKQPKEEVWKKLIAGLSGRFFVINNMDKESGFVNLSYSGDPSKYVDCGELYYFFENARGPREYRFAGSSPTASYETMVNGMLCRVDRSMSLEGRINIIVQPDGDTTRVSVNVRYVLTKKSQFLPVMGYPPPLSVETIQFDSKGSQVAYQAGTTCGPTGLLESEILSILR